jgi:DNA invertase Pin-like site-specific DNA recombinase
MNKAVPLTSSLVAIKGSAAPVDDMPTRSAAVPVKEDEAEEAERDRIRERIGQVKADQKARGRYLGGKVPFGYRRGESGDLIRHEAEQEAIGEMVELRRQGKALRTIAEAIQVRGFKISHEGVAGVLKATGG